MLLAFEEFWVCGLWHFWGFVPDKVQHPNTESTFFEFLMSDWRRDAACTLS